MTLQAPMFWPSRRIWKSRAALKRIFLATPELEMLIKRLNRGRGGGPRRKTA